MLDVCRHKAIAGYMKQCGYSECLSAFTREAALDLDAAAIDAAAKATMLEKKWTSVIRLQKKVMELEEKLGKMETVVQATAPVAALPGRRVNGNVMPTEPALHTLSGHRAAVSKVAFHPVYNVVVTASEDASMKVYDYESGQFERTLAGHTDSVEDVCFRPNGEMLASCSSDLTVKLWDFSQTTR